MKIGTDISIQECRASGYPVIEFKVRKLFPNGRKEGIDKDFSVYVTISEPERWPYGYLTKGHGHGYSCISWLSWNELVEMIEDSLKNSLESFMKSVDRKILPSKIEKPTEYNLLNLISDFNWNFGLDDYF